MQLTRLESMTILLWPFLTVRRIVYSSLVQVDLQFVSAFAEGVDITKQ